MAGAGATLNTDWLTTIIKSQMGDSASIDAFGRLRVSNPTSIFDSQAQYNDNTTLWQNKITNTSGNAAVSHLADESTIALTVESNDSITRQSRQYFRYQPGKSQLIMLTFVFSPGVTNLVQRIGYYDDENGLYLELNENTINCVLRTSVSGSVVNNSIPQASWNLDKMDGTGPSGIVLDPTKAQIFITDIEWLGVGRVRAGLVIDGVIFYVHEFLHANILQTAYMTTANLPIRYEIMANGAVTGSHVLRSICSQVSSEGGMSEISGFPFSATNGNTLKNITTSAFSPIISIRPKQLFNGITNRGIIIPESYNIYSQDQSIAVQTVFGATLTDALWTSVNTESIVEFSVAATAMTGGTVISSDFAAAVSSGNSGGVLDEAITSRVPLTLDIDGNHPISPLTDVFTISATSLVGNTDVVANINWKELR